MLTFIIGHIPQKESVEFKCVAVVGVHQAQLIKRLLSFLLLADDSRAKLLQFADINRVFGELLPELNVEVDAASNTLLKQHHKIVEFKELINVDGLLFVVPFVIVNHLVLNTLLVVVHEQLECEVATVLNTLGQIVECTEFVIKTLFEDVRHQQMNAPRLLEFHQTVAKQTQHELVPQVGLLGILLAALFQVFQITAHALIGRKLTIEQVGSQVPFELYSALRFLEVLETLNKLDDVLLNLLLRLEKDEWFEE